MRQKSVAALIIVGGVAGLGGCESLPEGALGEIGQSVLGDVMGEAAASASVKMIRDTAESMCSSGDAMCQNLTMTAMAGFTESFIDQLSKGDVRRINDARERAIVTGEAQEWENPETGSSGRVSTEPAPPRPPAPTPVAVKKNQLQSLPMMDAVGQPYVVSAAGGARVRGGPGTDYPVVERLADNEKIQAIGRVRDENWYMVGRGSVGIGYVHGDLLQPWQPPADEPLDEALEEVAEPDLEEAQVAEVQVEMAAECFTTTQTVTLSNGRSEQATVTSCRTPDGWAQV